MDTVTVPQRHPIYFIGGTSCSGKSACANALAKKYDCHLYHTDEHAFGKFMFGLSETELEHYPAIKLYKDYLCQGIEAFIRRDTSLTFKAFINYCEEVFPLLLQDILSLSIQKAVIAEGAHLFPSLLKKAGMNNAIFLISSDEQLRTIWFLEMHEKIPGGHPKEIQDFHDPGLGAAFAEKRLELHSYIANYLKQQAENMGATYLYLDNDKSLVQITEKLQRIFCI